VTRAALRFDPRDYEEEVVLKDGTAVVLRAVRPEDKELFARGFEELSPETRYRRFFASRQRLSERDLTYLTELDGDRHFAIGAVQRDAVQREIGLGVARFVRTAEDATVAEPAVTVIDAFQNRGLGGLLCRRLGEAAAERGITRFRSEVLVSNDPMRHILESLAPGATVKVEDDTATIEFDVVPPAPEPANIFEQLLKAAARGLLILRRAVSG
jgi:GNAT superfamily N-acetyltransferase